jgi:hypothetical protein
MIYFILEYVCHPLLAAKLITTKEHYVWRKEGYA